MAKSTSITLGENVDGVIAKQINTDRYGSARKVVRADLRTLEDEERKFKTLRALVEEGHASGTAKYSYDSLMQELGK